MKLSQTFLTQKPSLPLLKVELPEGTAKRSFTLKESTIKLLTNYAHYLSEHYSQKVDEDIILESLVRKLAADKGFRSWQKEQPE